ncbi:hypothetical protein ACFQ1M_13985 [Sungkyunkwania multivorans]|uniref:50S ribosomal protein L27 n=1 Tax=Sungkyunkwania multivorans TaxID=1173618 RepID=A0ABW3D131_9FLAO
MHEAVLFLHSYWAYLVLLILIIATINAIAKFSNKKEFNAKDLRISLFALIVSHIQLLIGIVLYFVSPRFSLWTDPNVNVMKDSLTRLYLVEHPFTNILAIVFITMGWSKHKKKVNSTQKFKVISIFYGLGLILLLSRIPWDSWI